MNEKETKIKPGTVARTIILTLALINQILQSTGRSIIPVSDAQIQELVSLVFTIGSAIAAWWYNNSFTEDAIKADQYFDELREKKQ